VLTYHLNLGSVKKAIKMHAFVPQIGRATAPDSPKTASRAGNAKAHDEDAHRDLQPTGKFADNCFMASRPTSNFKRSLL